jgi:hypothetical protein
MWLGAPPPGMSLFDAIGPIHVPDPIPTNDDCIRLLKLANQHRQAILMGLQVMLEHTIGVHLHSVKKNLISYFHKVSDFREKGKKCIESFVARDNGAAVTPALHDALYREFTSAVMKSKELDLLQKDVFHLFLHKPGLGVTADELKPPKQPDGGTLSWKLIKDHFPIFAGAVLSTLAIKSPQLLNYFDWNQRVITWGVPGLSMLGAVAFDSPPNFVKDVVKTTWETTQTVGKALISSLPITGPTAAGVAYLYDFPRLAFWTLIVTAGAFTIQFRYNNRTAVKNDVIQGIRSTARGIQNFAQAYIRNGWLTGFAAGAGAGLLARVYGVPSSSSWGFAGAVYCAHASAAAVARAVED